MVDPDWIEHRRCDGELLGWMLPEGEGFVPIDLFGRALAEPIEWLAAEDVLESVGIRYLAEPYELRLDDGEWLRMRVVEVSTTCIRVKKDDWGAVGSPPNNYTLPWPIPDTLRLLDLPR